MDKKLLLLVIMFILVGIFIFLVINQDIIDKKAEQQKQIPEKNSSEIIPEKFYTIKARLSDPFILKVNQSAFFESGNIKLIFLGVSEDSRCPSDVQCIQKGNAVLNLAFLRNNDLMRKFTLSDLDDEQHYSSITLSNYSIKLLDLVPYPKSPTRKIKISDYNATFVVYNKD